MKNMKWIGAALVALILALGAPAYGAIPGPIGGGVAGVVTDLGGGVFQYDYTVYAGWTTAVDGGGVGLEFDVIFPVGPVIDSFLIPFFDPEAVAIIPGSIQTPPGSEWAATFRNTADSFWSYDPLVDPDQFNYEVPADVFVDPPFVLEFSTDTANLGTSGQLAAVGVLIDGFSFQSHFSDTNGPVVIGYPSGLAAVDPPHVKSPSHPAAAIPEPAGLALIGLAALALRRRK